MLLALSSKVDDLRVKGIQPRHERGVYAVAKLEPQRCKLLRSTPWRRSWECVHDIAIKLPGGAIG
jgi:hypothetical protein